MTSSFADNKTNLGLCVFFCSKSFKMVCIFFFQRSCTIICCKQIKEYRWSLSPCCSTLSTGHLCSVEFQHVPSYWWLTRLARCVPGCPRLSTPFHLSVSFQLSAFADYEVWSHASTQYISTQVAQWAKLWGILSREALLLTRWPSLKRNRAFNDEALCHTPPAGVCFHGLFFHSHVYIYHTSWRWWVAGCSSDI